MTDQPMETFRFVNFLAIAVSACFVAQGYGMLMGSFFEINVSIYFDGSDIDFWDVFCIVTYCYDFKRGHCRYFLNENNVYF